VSATWIRKKNRGIQGASPMGDAAKNIPSRPPVGVLGVSMGGVSHKLEVLPVSVSA